MMIDGRRHIEPACECVIDPDCNRIPRCNVELDAILSEATIRVGEAIWSRYKWASNELVRKNGLVNRSGPMRLTREKGAGTCSSTPVFFVAVEREPSLRIADSPRLILTEKN